MKCRIEQLVEHIHMLQGDDHCAVTIVVPSALLGQSINRQLLASGMPFFNVRVETVRQHILQRTEAIRIAASEGTWDATDQAATVRAVLQEVELTSLEAATNFPSYTRLVAHVIEELRLNLNPCELEEAFSSGAEKICELLTVFRAYMEKKGRTLDYADLVQEYQASSEALLLWRGVNVKLSRFERKALGRAKLTVLPETLLYAGPSPDISIGSPLSSFHEVREVLRKVFENKYPLDTVAVVAPNGYIPLFLAEAEQLDIPVYCPEGSPQVAPHGAIFATTLDVIENRYGYEHLRRWLLRRNKGACVRALAEAGAAMDYDAIEAGLRLAKQAEETRKGVALDPDNNRYDRLSRELALLRACENARSKPHELATLILKTIIPSSRDKNLLKGICDELAQVEPEASYDRWSLLVRDRIERVRLPVGEAGKGILLTTSMDPGFFEHIFCIGLTEDAYPRRYREDPLLLDAERGALNKRYGSHLRMAGVANQLETESLQRCVGMAGATWRGSLPQMDLLSGKLQHCTPYLQEICGEELSLEQFQEYIDQAKQRWIPTNPDEVALDRCEWMTAHIEQDASQFVKQYALADAAAGHLAAERDRWNPAPGIHSGLIGSDLRKGQDDGGRYSASELQKFMTCPYQWFLEYRLGIRPVEAPEDLRRPSGRVVGSLIHVVLEQFLKSPPVRPYERDVLAKQVRELVAKHAKAAGDTNLIHVAALENSLLALIDSFLKYEEGLPEDRRTTKVELTFGHRHKECSHDDPVEIDTGKHHFMLPGSIDRIDCADSEAYIIDYKGSKPDNYRSRDFKGGRHLQQGLYAEALAKLPEGNGVEKISTGYLPLKKNSKDFLMMYDERRASELREFLDQAFDMMSVGWVPTTADECTYCQCHPVCGRLRGLIAEKKREGAMKTEALRQLAAQWQQLRDGENDEA